MSVVYAAVGPGGQIFLAPLSGWTLRRTIGLTIDGAVCTSVGIDVVGISVEADTLIHTSRAGVGVSANGAHLVVIGKMALTPRQLTTIVGANTVRTGTGIAATKSTAIGFTYGTTDIPSCRQCLRTFGILLCTVSTTFSATLAFVIVTDPVLLPVRCAASMVATRLRITRGYPVKLHTVSIIVGAVLIGLAIRLGVNACDAFVPTWV